MLGQGKRHRVFFSGLQDVFSFQSGRFRELIAALLGGFATGGYVMMTVPYSEREKIPRDGNHSSGIPNRQTESLLPSILQKIGFASPSFALDTTPLSGTLGPHFLVDAAAKASPSVVNIFVSKRGKQVGGSLASGGSGFIIDSEGTVVTNAHVLSECIHKDGDNNIIMVTLSDGKAFKANIIAWDAPSDLAVLKLEADCLLPSCRLGTSSSLRAGEFVLAIGSPLGMSNTVTAGIISCVERGSFELGLRGIATGGYIQTDAAINRGSSGGPLVNLQGEVVGVSCMKALAADGVSFAIPIDTAKEVIAELLEYGKVIRPFIGVKLLELNHLNVSQMRLLDKDFPNVTTGILIPHVHKNSPAQKAGLMPGDIIVSYGIGNPAHISGLVRALKKCIKTNDGLELRVLRRDAKNTKSGEDVLMQTLTLRIIPEEAQNQDVEQRKL